MGWVPGEFSTVSTDLIESRFDDYFAREECVREDAVAEFDLTNSEYARVLYLRDNPSTPGSYLSPRVEYRYFYSTGAIEPFEEATGSFCY